MKDIQIGSLTIGPSHAPCIVAELSGNHNGSLERAYKMIAAAHQAGVHAIKLQTYTPDTLTLNSNRDEFRIHDSTSLWAERNLYELYQEAHTPWEWHPLLFSYCRTLGIEVFSSPFDESAVDFLETLDAPCYKIASPEIVDHALIRRVAKTGKPILLSTGAANLVEIAEAVDVIRGEKCQDLLLLLCTAAYPAEPKDANLLTLRHMQESFDVLVGLSDHSLGIGVAIASVALGACLIEKHFTLSRAEVGVDSAFSMNPEEFHELVIESKRAWEALGKINYAPDESEKVTHSHRRSLYFVEDLCAGTIVQKQHIRSVRPGFGLPPKVLQEILGLTVTEDIVKNTPVSWDLFKKN